MLWIAVWSREPGRRGARPGESPDKGSREVGVDDGVPVGQSLPLGVVFCPYVGKSRTVDGRFWLISPNAVEFVSYPVAAQRAEHCEGPSPEQSPRARQYTSQALRQAADGTGAPSLSLWTLYCRDMSRSTFAAGVPQSGISWPRAVSTTIRTVGGRRSSTARARRSLANTARRGILTW